MKIRYYREIVLTSLIWIGCIGYAEAATDEMLHDRKRVTLLERSLTNLYFYPINRILDLHDVIHFGIAGSLGLGAEVAITENLSLGGYYTAKEAGIAYHGHHKRLHWLDFPSWGWGNPALAPVGLIPGIDAKQRKHSVEHGYATSSFGPNRYESSEDESLHFKRYSDTAFINRELQSESDLEAEENLITSIDGGLNKDNEAAIRAEVVAGLVHPYVALELYELLDFVTGIFFLDTKSDDWSTEPSSNKLRKLGRGVSNIGSGILEIPLNIVEVNENDGGLAAITYGAYRGVWRFMVRSLFVGPWEVLTFPHNTDTIIEPEFPFATSTSDSTWRVKYK